MPYVAAGGTAWTSPGGSFRRVEADESYYLGETVLRYRLVTDEDLLNEFLGVNPPQLVVEIERTHGDAGKPGVYRDLGVAEMWRVEAHGWPELSVEILELQHPKGVRTIDTSTALPGLTPALVARTIKTAHENGAEDNSAVAGGRGHRPRDTAARYGKRLAPSSRKPGIGSCELPGSHVRYRSIEVRRSQSFQGADGHVADVEPRHMTPRTAQTRNPNREDLASGARWASQVRSPGGRAPVPPTSGPTRHARRRSVP